MVEFVLVTVVAVGVALAVAQLGLFLWERNALMGSLSEGARVFTRSLQRRAPSSQRREYTVPRLA